MNNQTTIRLLKRRGGIWQVELRDGGVAEFGSAETAIQWVMIDFNTHELHIIVPDNLPEAA